MVEWTLYAEGNLWIKTNAMLYCVNKWLHQILKFCILINFGLFDPRFLSSSFFHMKKLNWKNIILSLLNELFHSKTRNKFLIIGFLNPRRNLQFFLNFLLYLLSMETLHQVFLFYSLAIRAKYNFHVLWIYYIGLNESLKIFP